MVTSKREVSVKVVHCISNLERSPLKLGKTFEIIQWKGSFLNKVAG